MSRRAQRSGVAASEEAEAVALLNAVALFRPRRGPQWRQVVCAVEAQLRGAGAGAAYAKPRAKAQYDHLVAQFRRAVASNGVEAPLPRSDVLRGLLETAVANEDAARASTGPYNVHDVDGDTEEEEENQDEPSSAVMSPGTTTTSDSLVAFTTPLQAPRRPLQGRAVMTPPVAPRVPVSLVSLSLPSTPTIVVAREPSARKRQWEARIAASRRVVRRVDLMRAAGERAATATTKSQLLSESGDHIETASHATEQDVVDEDVDQAYEEPNENGSVEDAPAEAMGARGSTAQSSGTRDVEDEPESPIRTPDSGSEAVYDTAVVVHAHEAIEPVDDEPEPVSKDASVTDSDMPQASMASELCALRTAQSRLERQFQDLLAAFTTSQKTQTTLQGEVDELRASHDTAVQENVVLRNEIRQLAQEDSTSKLAELTQVVSTLSEGLRRSREEREQLKEDIALVKTELDQTAARHRDLIGKVLTLARQTNVLKGKTDDNAELLDAHTARLDQIDSTVLGIEEHIQTLRGTIEELRRDISAETEPCMTQQAVLKAELMALRDQMSQQQVARQELAEKLRCERNQAIRDVKAHASNKFTSVSEDVRAAGDQIRLLKDAQSVREALWETVHTKLATIESELEVFKEFSVGAREQIARIARLEQAVAADMGKTGELRDAVDKDRQCWKQWMDGEDQLRLKTEKALCDTMQACEALVTTTRSECNERISRVENSFIHHVDQTCSKIIDLDAQIRSLQSHKDKLEWAVEEHTGLHQQQSMSLDAVSTKVAGLEAHTAMMNGEDQLRLKTERALRHNRQACEALIVATRSECDEKISRVEKSLIHHVDQTSSKCIGLNEQIRTLQSGKEKIESTLKEHTGLHQQQTASLDAVSATIEGLETHTASLVRTAVQNLRGQLLAMQAEAMNADRQVQAEHAERQRARDEAMEQVGQRLRGVAETEAKLKEEIEACQLAISTHMDLQKNRDGAFMTLETTVEKNRRTCMDRHVIVLQTLKTILENS